MLIVILILLLLFGGGGGYYLGGSAYHGGIGIGGVLILIFILYALGIIGGTRL